MQLTYKFIITIVLIYIQFGCSSLNPFGKVEQLNDILTEFHDPYSDRVLIAAHRAYHSKYPENSLAAIKHSIESGIDIIEIDVRQTKDGKIVLMHDSSIDRTTTGSGQLSDFTYNQLLEFELKKNNSDKLAHKIPLLREALKIAKDKIMIDIDIKGAPLNKLVSIVTMTETEKQSIFFDSEFPVLDSILAINDNLIIMPRARSEKDVDEILLNYDPQIIHIDPSFYNNTVITKIKQSGARIWINALGKPDSIASSGNIELGYGSLLSGGANVIQTDMPVILKEYLDSRN